MVQIDAYWVVLDDGRPFWAEAFIPGEFKKHNNNARWQEVNNARNTPQSFSHFTAEVTECELMVVDVQGVGDLYTDPQIHSTCGTQQYGVGNLGHLGMAMFFQTHVCNDLCRYLGLSPFARQDKSHAIFGEPGTGSNPSNHQATLRITGGQQDQSNHTSDMHDMHQQDQFNHTSDMAKQHPLWERGPSAWSETDLAAVMCRMPFVWDSALEWPRWERNTKLQGTLQVFAVADLIENPHTTNTDIARDHMLWHIFKAAEYGVPPACEFCVVHLADFLPDDQIQEIRARCRRPDWAGHADGPLERSGALEELEWLIEKEGSEFGDSADDNAPVGMGAFDFSGAGKADSVRQDANSSGTVDANDFFVSLRESGAVHSAGSVRERRESADRSGTVDANDFFNAMAQSTSDSLPKRISCISCISK